MFSILALPVAPGLASHSGSAMLQPDAREFRLASSDAGSNGTASNVSASCPAIWPPISPCEVAPARLAALNPGENENSPIPSFFLHHEGAFDLDDRVQCFLQAVGNPNGTQLDLHIPPSLAEIEIDFPLILKLRDHPSRTDYSPDANYNIIGSAFVTSYQAALLPGSPCGTLDDHYKRTQSIAESLRDMPSFNRASGRDFVLNVATLAINQAHFHLIPS